MKRSMLQHPVGSAEYVIAHGAYQQSRGRRPSTKYLTELNPRKALASARMVKAQTMSHALLDAGCISIAKNNGPHQVKWGDLTDIEAKVFVRGIVLDSMSEREIIERLRQVGYEGDEPAICMTMPTDPTGFEARDLVRALGGLIAKNGAMVMVMMTAPSGDLLMP